MSRPSVYLETKINALLGAVDFFTANHERRLTFLAQIDFWEWEMEELIFSVDNFKQRSQAWKATGNSIEQMLAKQNIVVRRGALLDVNWWKHARRADAVHAPVERLNYVISRWNNLLDVCVQSLFMNKMEDKIEQFGLNALPNLDKFKKQDMAMPVEAKEAE